MKVKEEKSKGLNKKFNVVLDVKDFEKDVDSRLEKLAKTTKLPGFRPGKAPLSMLKQKYRASVLGEALDAAINKAADSIISENKLRVAVQPDIKITKFEDGKDIEFEMNVEVLPEIKLGDFSKIKLERLTSEVPESEVNKSLEYVAASRRETESIKGNRQTKKGDIAVIDFTGSVDGVEFKGGKGTDYPLELGSNSFIPGFEDQLIGHKKGEKVEVKVKFPENYHAKNLAGKDAVFATEIKDIKTLKKIEINDDFAKSLGEKDLATLKEKVVERIKQDYDAASKMKLKRALLDLLDKEYKIEVPSKLLDAEYNSILKQYEHAKKHNELDEYEKSKDEKALIKEYKEIATRRVKLGLILSEVGIQAKIAIAPDDINKAIMNEARRYPGQEKAVLDYYLKNKEAVESLKAPVMEEKIVDHILSQVKLTDKVVPVEELYKFDDK